MKKIVYGLFIGMLLFVCAACEPIDEDMLIGEWKCTSIKSGNFEVPSDILSSFKIYMDFNSGGFGDLYVADKKCASGDYTTLSKTKVHVDFNTPTGADVEYFCNLSNGNTVLTSDAFLQNIPTAAKYKEIFESDMPAALIPYAGQTFSTVIVFTKQ